MDTIVGLQKIGECGQRWPDDVIAQEMDRIAKALNGDARFLKEIAECTPTTLVLSATDTGREVMIVLDGKGVRVGPYDGEPFDAKIQATEHVHSAVLTGKMDADAAFFTRKVRIRGSLVAAFRLKNRFLSFLQWHWTRRPQAAGECAETAKRKDNNNG